MTHPQNAYPAGQHLDPAGAAAVPPPQPYAPVPGQPDTPVAGQVVTGQAYDGQAPSMHQMQQRAEGVPEVSPEDDPTKVFFRARNDKDPGRFFRMSDRIGLMPLLRFASSARGGVDQKDPRALIALYDMIGDCIDQERPQRIVVDPATGQTKVDEFGQPVYEDAGPSQWDEFQDYATEVKADEEDLMELVGTVIERLASRPKSPPGNSPDGQARTLPNSKDTSPSPGSSPPVGGRVPPELDGLTSVDSLVNARS